MKRKDPFETLYPPWGRLEVAHKLTGLPYRKIRDLASSGEIRARKINTEVRNSAMLYCIADICDWLDQNQ